MRIDSRQPDPAILAELGTRLRQIRLAQNLSQAEVAKEAGVGRSTVQRIEEGLSVSTTNLIRVLRALELLDDLDGLVPESVPAPVEQLLHQRARRQRARSRPRHGGSSGGSEGPVKPWRWGDEDKDGER